MIKLSKENIVVWKIIFPAIVFIPHILIVIGVISLGVPLLIIVYLAIAFLQFFIGGIWRYPLLKDVVLNEDKKSITIISLNDKEEVLISDILNLKTKFGITNVQFAVSGNKRTVYFKPNNIENLRLII
jgi:hypothetical protein